MSFFRNLHSKQWTALLVIAYARKELVQKQELVLPWLAGYEFNNVDHAICDCWKVKPEPATAKEPVYLTIPAIIAAGDVDPWCRPSV